MSLVDDLIPLLKKLRLSGILETLDLRKKEAVDDDLGHAEFLYRLLSDEVERREPKQLGLRLRRASFEDGKTLEDFDFRFKDQVPKATVLDLATCAFIDKRENILFVGQAGVGKSHLAQALGHRACRGGHKLLFVGAQAMLSLPEGDEFARPLRVPNAGAFRRIGLNDGGASPGTPALTPTTMPTYSSAGSSGPRVHFRVPAGPRRSGSRRPRTARTPPSPAELPSNWPTPTLPVTRASSRSLRGRALCLGGDRSGCPDLESVSRTCGRADCRPCATRGQCGRDAWVR